MARAKNTNSGGNPFRRRTAVILANHSIYESRAFSLRSFVSSVVQP